VLATSELQIPRPRVVRVFYIYADFRVRVDDNSPVHYDAEVRRMDTQGNKWLLTFRVFALDRKGRLMIFEYKWPIRTSRRFRDSRTWRS